ncbi:hypothetical protein GQ600_22491 [Phytophthora cactorum]|nr:hypothetical protein GQ600_22491 [Phytophthora cactorum]
MMPILGKDWRPCSASTLFAWITGINPSNPLTAQWRSAAPNPEQFKKEFNRFSVEGDSTALTSPHIRGRSRCSVKVGVYGLSGLATTNLLRQVAIGTVCQAPNASDAIGIEAPVLMDCTDGSAWKRSPSLPDWLCCSSSACTSYRAPWRVTLLYLNEVTKSNPLLRAKTTAVQLRGYQIPSDVLQIANA